MTLAGWTKGNHQDPEFASRVGPGFRDCGEARKRLLFGAEDVFGRQDYLYVSVLLTTVQASMYRATRYFTQVGRKDHGTGPFQIAVGAGLFCPAQSRLVFPP